MIEMLPGFAPEVVALAAAGRVTKEDYDRVVIPGMAQAFRGRAKIRCYLQVAPDVHFEPGAAWKDFKLGIEHYNGWERVAVVSDVEWLRVATKVMGVLMPGEVRVFGQAQADEAKRWVAG
jgi:hypothetical protein